MKEFYLKNKENADKIIHFAILSAFIYVFFKYLSGYFAPLIFGYIVCLILSPAVNFLSDKFKMPRSLASVLSIGLLIFLIIFLGTSLVTNIIDEAKSFVENSPELVSGIIDNLRTIQEKALAYLDILPESLTERTDKLLDSFISVATDLVGTGVKVGSVEVVKFLPNVLFVTLLGIICSFFLLNDRKNIESFILRQLPENARQTMSVAKSGVLKAIGGYIKAQCTLMCIVAVVCITGLLILESPYALFLGIIISIVDALPVFGSGAIFWPWCIYSLIVGNYKMAVGIAVINITIIITRQMLEPRILGNQIGIHPIATLMSIFIGLKVFGIFGFIIGPFILITIKAMQDNDFLPKWK